MNIIEALLTPNEYSRPQIPLKPVKGVVVHWVANPGTPAINNRNFFENRKYGETDYGSAHYIIDLNGDVVRCIPDNEMAYHCGSKTYTPEALAALGSYPNNNTIGIECTHVDWNGVMTQQTYNVLVELCASLCKQYNLDPQKDLWLHKTVVGWKDCHKWFVDNPTEWQSFKTKVANTLTINQGGGFTVADLMNMEKELRAALKIPDSSWATSEIDRAIQRGLIGQQHDPNEIVTFGVYITIANRILDAIDSLKITRS